MRTTWLSCLFLAAAASVSCGKKSAPPPSETAAPSAEQPDDEGIIEAAGKTVDYFTGKTHLDAKKRIESQLDKIQEEQDRRLKEAMGE